MTLFAIRYFMMIFLIGMGSFIGRARPIEKIILDTDMGSDCDDVGALALLHHYAQEGQAEILGIIYSSGRVPYGAGVIDAINHYYHRADLPIGACHSHCIGDPVDKMNAKQLASDTDTFGHKIVRNKDAIEQTILNRQLLAKQDDSSVTYITIGHTQGLYSLLRSAPDGISGLTGEELVRKKVKRWIALGALDADNLEKQYRKDWNFYRNGTAPYTEYLIKNFPVDMYFINAGSNVFSGASLKDTPLGNIVRTAYEKWLSNTQQKTLADQRSSWDLIAVYYAVEGCGDFLENGEPGYLDFEIERGSRWIMDQKSMRKKQHFINQKSGIEEAFGAYLNTLIAKPPKRR